MARRCDLAPFRLVRKHIDPDHPTRLRFIVNYSQPGAGREDAFFFLRLAAKARQEGDAPQCRRWLEAARTATGFDTLITLVDKGRQGSVLP